MSISRPERIRSLRRIEPCRNRQVGRTARRDRTVAGRRPRLQHVRERLLDDTERRRSIPRRGRGVPSTARRREYGLRTATGGYRWRQALLRVPQIGRFGVSEAGRRLIYNTPLDPKPRSSARDQPFSDMRRTHAGGVDVHDHDDVVGPAGSSVRCTALLATDCCALPRVHARIGSPSLEVDPDSLVRRRRDEPRPDDQLSAKIASSSSGSRREQDMSPTNALQMAAGSICPSRWRDGVQRRGNQTRRTRAGSRGRNRNMATLSREDRPATRRNERTVCGAQGRSSVRLALETSVRTREGRRAGGPAGRRAHRL